MPAKKTASTPRKPRETKKFIRNIRAVPVSLRLESGRKINLKPRGSRGDLVPVSKAEREDELFILNEGQLFETISVAEGKDILEKQATNQHTEPHPALSAIRNSNDEAYTEGVKIEKEHTRQSVTVGEITKTGPEEKESIQRIQMKRVPAPGTSDNPVMEGDPEQIADEVARNKSIDGPAAGLGNIKQVTIEAPTKSN